MLRPLHPLHAIFLAGALSLFLGALLGDIAYAYSFEVQWKNFASWLLVGGLLWSGFAAAWAIVDFARLAGDRGPRRVAYVASIVAVVVLGIGNAFVHAGDAWQGMPAGLVLSGLVAVLSFIATWLGFANYRTWVRP